MLTLREKLLEVDERFADVAFKLYYVTQVCHQLILFALTCLRLKLTRM